MNPAFKNSVSSERKTINQLGAEKDSIVVQAIRVRSGKALVNYSYMLINRRTSEAVVIDPAWEITKIRAVLKARDCKLTAILLTHHHRDHTDLASELASETGALVYMSPMEIDTYSFTAKNLSEIRDSHVVSAGMRINVIETPGHTAGSVCFSVGGYLFTGDTLFIEGCGICKGKGASADQLFESLRLIQSTFPGSTQIFPGHRFREAPGKSLDFVKANNIYMKVNSRSDFKTLHMRKRDISSIEYL